MTDTLTITRPDDWHVHLRDGAVMAAVVGDTAARFARAVVMPNLSPPVVSVADALAYRARILNALPADASFTPLMSLFLTDDTDAAAVADAANNAHIIGYKLYPAGATTHSAAGVTRVAKVMPVLEAMAKHGVVLQVHGEVTDEQVDVFDREAVFVEQILSPLHRELPELKIVLEHVTTDDGVAFVRDAGDTLAASVTAHHLMFNRNEMFRGGLRPHLFCLPVLKRERHRRALLAAATAGDRSFFLGTDSAPHRCRDKETACGCAGIYSAHAGIEFYAEIFDAANALDKLEPFASFHGADFYGLPRNHDRLTLTKKPRRIPDTHDDTDDAITPLNAGQTITWSLTTP